MLCDFIQTHAKQHTIVHTGVNIKVIFLNSWSVGGMPRVAVLEPTPSSSTHWTLNAIGYLSLAPKSRIEPTSTNIGIRKVPQKWHLK